MCGSLGGMQETELASELIPRGLGCQLDSGYRGGFRSHDREIADVPIEPTSSDSPAYIAAAAQPPCRVVRCA